MDIAHFWAIMDKVAIVGGESGQQVATLRGLLEPLPATEVKGFCDQFEHALHVAYSWDLWGAAFVIHGGCSDDGFEYFRRWLVTLGRERFETAVKNADSLADVPATAAVDGVFEFEEILYAAVEVAEAKGGMDPRGNREADDAAVGPQGNPFSEEPAQLAVRYPRLWTKYGHAPLG